jgi:hypothetical protein
MITIHQKKNSSRSDLDWLKVDWLQGTIYYQSVDEVQGCIDYAYKNSPDSDGDNNIADYEMLECGY